MNSRRDETRQIKEQLQSVTKNQQLHNPDLRSSVIAIDNILSNRPPVSRGQSTKDKNAITSVNDKDTSLAMPRPIDTSPLRQKTKAEAVSRIKQHPSASAFIKSTGHRLIGVSSIISIGLIGAAIFTTTTYGISVWIFTIIISAGIFAVVILLSHFRKTSFIRANAPILAFCEANNLAVSWESDEESGFSGTSIVSNDGKFFAGNKTFPLTLRSNGSDRDRYATVPCFGFILDRNLPHIYLDSRIDKTRIRQLISTDRVSLFDTNQVLQLEGDFNKYFTLYVPKKFERDALYIFTPDVMALLIDQVESFDVEIKDNVAYFYANTDEMQFDNPALWERIENISARLGEKLQDNAGSYRFSESESSLEIDNVNTQPHQLSVGGSRILRAGVFGSVKQFILVGLFVFAFIALAYIFVAVSSS